MLKFEFKPSPLYFICFNKSCYLSALLILFFSTLTLSFCCFRKVKDAWDNKRDMLVKSGAFAIEQLSEALSASAGSNQLPDGLPQNALRLCAEQVCFYLLRT